MTRCLSALGAASLACLSLGQIAKSGSGYLMRYAFKKGMVMSYLADIDANVGGRKQAMQMTMTLKVLDVSKGLATIRVSGSTGKGAPTNDTTVKVDNRGRTVGGVSGEQLALFPMPEKPVKVGQSWTSQSQVLVPGMGNMKSASTLRLKQITTVKGKPVAVVTIDSQSKGGTNMKTSGTYALLMSDGTVKTANMKSTGKVALSQAGEKYDFVTLMKLNRQ